MGRLDSKHFSENWEYTGRSNFCKVIVRGNKTHKMSYTPGCSKFGHAHAMRDSKGLLKINLGSR